MTNCYIRLNGVRPSYTLFKWWIQVEGAILDRVSYPLQNPQGFQRFHLETRAAPSRRKVPSPFNPQVSKFGLASVLFKEALHYGLKLSRREYRTALLSRPCIYGVFGGRFGGFHPIKEKCTGCMRCVQEFPSVCRVDRNPEFYKFADSYWVLDDSSTATPSTSPVAIVSYEAETGTIPIKGMGYKGAFASRGWDSMWTDMSEIVRPTRDGVYGREYISTTVDFGRKVKFLDFHDFRPRSRILELSLPIIFNYLPPKMTNQSVLNSVAHASRRVGTFFVADPEQINWLHDAENVVPLLPIDDLDYQLVNRARALELTQYDTSALEKIHSINENAIVCVRLPLTGKAEAAALELARDSDVDVIHLSGNYHGVRDDDSALMKDILKEVHQTLVKESVRDEVTLIASGGITLAEHLPKAIICGADLVALDTTTLVALQAEFQGECITSDQGRIKSDAFDIEWGEQRLVNLLSSWHDQLIEILSAMGIRDVRRLRGDVGRAIFQEEMEREAFSGIDRGT